MAGVKITALPNYWLEYLLFDASAQIMASDFQWVGIFFVQGPQCLSIWLAKLKPAVPSPSTVALSHSPLEPQLGLQWLPLIGKHSGKGPPGSARLHCVGLWWLLIKSCFLYEMRVAHNSEMQMASTACHGEMKDTLWKSSVPCPQQERMEFQRKKLILYFWNMGKCIQGKQQLLLLDVINRKNKQKSLSSRH